MYYNAFQQYAIANNVLSTICKVGNISFFEFCSYRKTEHLNILRGLYCYISRERGVAPSRAARLICRTRCNIINQARKYWHYIQVKDPIVTELYNTINNVSNKIVMNDNMNLKIGDMLFPTDNDLEIPTLDIDMQAQQCTIPFLCFGEQKRTYNLNHSGALHFYTDDYRFNAIYEHPEKILQHNPSEIVEPNGSLFNEMPISFGLQAIYKKRWIARVMQAKGVRVFVDLNVAQKYYQLNMIGVPRGWYAFATRGYSERLNNLEFEYSIAKDWAEGKKPLFVIYGGGDMCRRFAQRNECIYINPVVTTKKKIDAMKKIHEGIAFLGEEFSLKKQLSNITPFMHQLEDYSK